MGASVTSFVTPTDADWWLVTVTSPAVLLLTPADGDADLRLATSNCHIICVSTSELAPDECLVNPGTYYAEVYYVGDPIGRENVAYQLTVTST